MCWVEMDSLAGCLWLSRSVNTNQGIPVLQEVLQFPKTADVSQHPLVNPDLIHLSLNISRTTI